MFLLDLIIFMVNILVHIAIYDFYDIFHSLILQKYKFFISISVKVILPSNMNYKSFIILYKENLRIEV